MSNLNYDPFGNRIGRIENGNAEYYVVDGWDTTKLNPVGNENFDVWADLNSNGEIKVQRAFGSGFDEVVARVDE